MHSPRYLVELVQLAFGCMECLNKINYSESNSISQDLVFVLPQFSSLFIDAHSDA